MGEFINFTMLFKFLKLDIYNKEIMVREFKFFRGYVDKTITEQWGELLREYPATPGTGIINWGGTTTNTPTWIVNPDWYSQQPYTITTTPGNYGTITIPNNYNGFTTGTATTSTLTTSNPNGITYTTGGFGGTLTTGTATYSSSSFKLQ
jgi:hypothetical protein